MTATLLPVPKARFFDASGAPLNLGKVYTYVAGTSTPKVTYTDANLGGQNQNPVVLDAAGEADIWLVGNYKILLEDADGTLQWEVDNVTDWRSVIDALSVNLADTSDIAKGDALIGVKQPYTGAVARTQHGKNTDLTTITDFGAVGDDSTSNTVFIQNALDALGNGGTLHFPMTPAGGIYRSGQLTISNDNIKLLLDGGVVLKFPVLGSSTSGIIVDADFFEINGGGTLQGPLAGVYVAGENGIYMVGSSTSSRKQGLSISNTEIKNFGAAGVYAQFVDYINVDDNHIHDCGLAGTSFLSCNIGTKTKNKVYDIGPGATSQMYGLQLTHNSVGYSSDPDAGTKDATNPFCWGWIISDNEVSGVDWTAIDNHGGYQINIHNNSTWGAKIGISLGKSSGDAAAYAGWDNSVTGNIINSNNQDGSLSGFENGVYPGLACGGGSTVNQQRLIIANNIVRGYGAASNTGGTCVETNLCDDVKISNNLIENWNGVAVYVTDSDAVVSDNLFGSMAAAVDTAATCISSSGTSQKITVHGNSHYGANPCRIGLSVSGSTTPIIDYGFNDFRVATVRQVNLNAGTQNVFGGGYANTITATDADTTPSIGALVGGGPGTLLLSTVASPYSIITFDDGLNGQTISVVNSTATAVTLVQGSTMKLLGGANIVLGQYDTATLRNFAGIYYMISSSNNA